jgi:hypothetical protein
MGGTFNDHREPDSPRRLGDWDTPGDLVFAVIFFGLIVGSLVGLYFLVPSGKDHNPLWTVARWMTIALLAWAVFFGWRPYVRKLKFLKKYRGSVLPDNWRRWW